MERLELAQQQSATKQMLDRVCQKMEANYEKIRDDMVCQEDTLRYEFEDRPHSGRRHPRMLTLTTISLIWPNLSIVRWSGFAQYP